MKNRANDKLNVCCNFEQRVYNDSKDYFLRYLCIYIECVLKHNILKFAMG